jgi:hypothetical protein
MFDLDNVCPLNFLVKHSKTCSPKEVVASCSPMEFSHFLLEGYCSLGQLSPLLLERTWCGLPIVFLHEAFNLKKLPKCYFFSSISFMEKQKKLKNETNLEPFG